jgi:superfamily II DNA/RNA helicase
VFVLSVLQQIEADDKDEEATVKAVVLCHTRELAFQARTLTSAVCPASACTAFEYGQQSKWTASLHHFKVMRRCVV